MRLIRWALLLACLVVFGVSWAGAQDGRLKVVATYSILGDLVANVGGDLIDLTVLVGAGGDSHVYEPTPRDAVALAEADVIFENGLGFEGWLDGLVEASGTSAVRVAVSDGIEPLVFGEAGHDHDDEHDHEHDHDHEHGEFDPHIWHDPNNAIVMVGNIRDALAAADPANAAAYEANAAAYIAQLEALDAYIREQMASLPETSRVLITSHDTFGYFGVEYGFEILTALASFSTETADPSAGQFAELIEQIKAEGVKAIFSENISASGLIERIAQEAGVAVGAELYTDALGEPGSPGATYLEMMRYNIDAIVGALR